MNRTRKFFAITVSALMLAAMFAGCTPAPSASPSAAASVAPSASAVAATTAAATTAAAEPAKTTAPQVHLVCAFPGAASKGQDAVLKAVGEKLVADGLNYSVEVKFLDDYWNKLALDVAGGTVEDIAWAHSSTLPDLVSKKVYQPIDDALKAVGQDLVANTPDYVLKGGQVGGKQYALPRVIPMAYYNNTIDIRGDLREKYGIPEIKSLDTFEQYLASIKKNEPSMQGFAGSNSQALYPVYADYFFPLGDGGASPVYYDPADKKAKSFLDSDAFTKICETKKKWRDNGWVVTTASDTVYPDELFETGMAAAVPSNVMRNSERADSMFKNVPGAKLETVLLVDKKKIYMAGDNMLAVPSSSKNTKDAVAFINWFKKSPDNYDLWSYGVKGVNYELQGNAVDTSKATESNSYSMNTWMWNDIRLARFSAHYPAQSVDMLKNWDKDAEVTPYVGFAMDVSTVKSQLSQVQAVIDEYFEGLGLGVTDINKVKAEMKTKLDAAGLNDLIAAAQTQIDAYTKK